MKKPTLIIALIIASCSVIFAQIEKQTANLNIEGQIMLSANAHALFLNLGGPALRLNFSKTSVGIDLYPSFKFENSASKLVISPLLGVGPQICFLKGKRFIIAIPCYYYSTKNFWIASLGFGYILTTSNK
jgi:hypothetical protein